MNIINLPFKVKKPVLACGADTKGSFALAKGEKAYLFEGFGDLSDPDNLKRYERSIALSEKKLAIKPVVVACDCHPGYFSTGFAEAHAHGLSTKDLCRVQHHEAHIASVMVEHNIKTDVIGAAFDGTGLGWDNRIWGGEFFAGGFGSFVRVAHLDYIPMPGSEISVREPWRMAVSYLYDAFGEDFLNLKIGAIRNRTREKLLIIKKAIDNSINSPVTSSAGRLFDAAASIALSKDCADFEAQLPIALEGSISANEERSYKFEIKKEQDLYRVVCKKMIREMVKDILSGADRSAVSAKFHNMIVDIIVSISSLAGKKRGIRKVALSGGVFQNRYIIKRAVLKLCERGFVPYINKSISTNDSGIPVGQIAIANARGLCA